MLMKHINKHISFITCMSLASTMLFGTMAQAADKPATPASATVVVGDLALPFSSGNVVKAMKEAATRGYTGENLDPIYITVAGTRKVYFNLNNAWSNSKENALNNGVDYWNKVKYVSTDGGSSFEAYTGNVTLSDDTTVVVRDEFSSFVQVNGSTFTIPSGLTLNDLKKMLKATDGTTQTYEISGLTDTSELVAGTTYNLSVTAEDKITKDSTTYKISVNAGGGGEIDLTIDQLKSVLKTQIAGAEALLSTVPNEKKTKFEKAIKTAKDFYNNITDDTTVQQITDAIAALADAVTEAFNKESYFDVAYNFDNTMGTVQAVYKGTSTAIPNGARVANNSEVTFTASPKTGYEVKSWTVNGIKDTVNVTSKDVTITKDTTVSVEFGPKSGSDEKTYYSVTYDFDNTMGIVQAVYKGTSTAIPNGARVANNSEVTFTASPKTGYEVKSWTVNSSKDTTSVTSKDVTITKDTTVEVEFGSKSTDEFTVTFDDKYSVNNKVYATVTSAVYNGNNVVKAIKSGEKVAKGAKIKFSVNVNDNNYTFTEWNITNNGADSTDSNETTDEITVNGNVTAKANFKDASSGTEKTKASVSFENNSVSSTVYNGTVSNTTYNVYAQLSDTQVEFNISNNKASVEFAIGAKVNSSNASANELSKLVSKLSFAVNSNSTNYVESTKIENGKLIVVLKTDKMENDNISTITLNTSFNNATGGTTNLKFKVTLK